MTFFTSFQHSGLPLTSGLLEVWIVRDHVPFQFLTSACCSPLVSSDWHQERPHPSGKTTAVLEPFLSRSSTKISIKNSNPESHRGLQCRAAEKEMSFQEHRVPLLSQGTDNSGLNAALHRPSRQLMGKQISEAAPVREKGSLPEMKNS